MNKIDIQTLSGGKAPLDQAALDGFRAGMRGPVLTSGDDGYDAARQIWNAMIDRKPAVIARCAGVADVLNAVRFASSHGFLTSIRGAGHNIGGLSLADGGFMIDLSLMKTVRVDPVAKRAHVEPGATLREFDHETQAFGLHTPVGINSTTGISGLTLGGGFGWTSRMYGLTIDNLVGADVVTADGKMVRVNDKENSDLFWAIRGGGGNFGVVTRFEFALHAMGPEIYAGLLAMPFTEAKSVLKKYRELVPTLPEHTNVWVVLRKAPPLPFLPESVHGKEIAVLAMFSAGGKEFGEKTAAKLREFAKPHGEHLGVMPFEGWQQAFDPLLTPGARNYWKTHNLTEISDGLIDVLVDYAGKLPDPQCEIFLGMLGSQVNKVAADATAYVARDAEFVINVHGRWGSAAGDEAGMGWARGFFKAAAPFASGGAYVNFMTQEEKSRVKDAYGKNYDRLLAVKKKVDPKNFFRVNQNIDPNG
jgi:FAD/FMN-containing dehydrogenase